MTLTKEEFKTLVMLYAANIDGNIQSEEVKIMLEAVSTPWIRWRNYSPR